MTATSQAHCTPSVQGSLAPRPRSTGLAWTSILLSLGLLVLSVLLVDSRQVFTRLETIDPRWLGAFFLVSLVQLVILGTRYAAIARALGLKLSWMKGSSEYALSVLVNQVLPSGVLGDGLRAIRHARQSKEHGLLEVFEAVALDRIAGYLALWLVVLATAPFGAGAELLNLQHLLLASAAFIAGLGVLLFLARRIERIARYASAVSKAVQNGARVLFAPKHAIVHLPLSLALTLLILVQLYIAARAVHVHLSAEQLLWLGPLILLATAVPSFFAGWGVREGASAMLFAAVGLPGSVGVAVAMVFGAFTLLVSLPGVVVLLFDAGRSEHPRTRWSQAHSLSMLAGLGLALWSGFPALLALVAALSFLILILQSRADWTPSGSFGMANAVTSVRLVLTASLLVGHSSWSGAALASIAVSVLLLDVLDGWLARRRSGSSDFGAKYDVEVDTVLVASLVVVLLLKGQAGFWILLPPLLRYAYVLTPLLFAPKRNARERTAMGRGAYVFMIATFVAGLVLPSEWSHALTAAGSFAVTLSFLNTFWQLYGPARESFTRSSPARRRTRVPPKS